MAARRADHLAAASALGDATRRQRDELDDAAVFEALFDAYYGSLSTFAYRYVRSRAIAEELVQEVFLYMWERRRRWGARDALKTYLFTSVRNAAISYLRHEGVARRREADTIELFSRQTPAADADLKSAELGHALQRAVALLPQRCRLVFTMSREQGMSYAEIADSLEISIKTVEVQMGRAYKTLRKALSPYWP